MELSAGQTALVYLLLIAGLLGTLIGNLQGWDGQALSIIKYNGSFLFYGAFPLPKKHTFVPCDL